MSYIQARNPYRTPIHIIYNYTIYIIYYNIYVYTRFPVLLNMFYALRCRRRHTQTHTRMPLNMVVSLFLPRTMRNTRDVTRGWENRFFIALKSYSYEYVIFFNLTIRLKQYTNNNNIHIACYYIVNIIHYCSGGGDNGFPVVII